MSKTCSFRWELGTEAVEPGQIEDILYNCLDFCQLYGRTPHFCLLAEKSEAAWPVLELLHGENADFSLLTDPESSECKPDIHSVVIDGSGNARLRNTSIGNLLEDRLADLWVTAGLDRKESMA